MSGIMLSAWFFMLVVFCIWPTWQDLTYLLIPSSIPSDCPILLALLIVFSFPRWSACDYSIIFNFSSLFTCTIVLLKQRWELKFKAWTGISSFPEWLLFQWVWRESPKINLIIVSFLLLISSMNHPNFLNQFSSLCGGKSFFVTDFHSLPTAFGLVLTFPCVGCNFHCTESVYSCSSSTSTTEVPVSIFSVSLSDGSRIRLGSVSVSSLGVIIESETCDWSCDSIRKSLDKQSAALFSFPLTYKISYLYSSTLNLHVESRELGSFTIFQPYQCLVLSLDLKWFPK